MHPVEGKANRKIGVYLLMYGCWHTVTTSGLQNNITEK